MITIVKYPSKQTLQSIIARPEINYDAVRATVADIITQVKKFGDSAIHSYTQQFDGTDPEKLELAKDEWIIAAQSLDAAVKSAIDHAFDNIRQFHAAQKEVSIPIETTPGIVCWRKSVAIEKAGLYIPGGTAPLFSTLLMLAIPAQLAGCEEIIVCTPPNEQDKIHPAILYAALKTGVTKIYKVGGAQAIAAMAYGTDSIPKVYKIFGPGNRYVTAAKMLLSAEGIAIDMPAGPSEVAVLADTSCIPAFVAADLLSQAEHGIDSQVLLISDSADVLDAVNNCLAEQIMQLPRAETAIQALQQSKAILVENMEDGMQIINEYAPEHLIIACRNSREWAEKVKNAGSVFLGNYAPETVGDYASGTNHTLPTNGAAKAFSGVSLDSFFKKITFQELSPEGLKNIAATVTTMARAEGLDAHANSIKIRVESLV